MRRSLLFVTVGLSVTLALATLTGCATPGPTVEDPKTELPKHYAGPGLQFSYPGNWRLKEQVSSTEHGEVRMITVGMAGPAAAFIRVFDRAPEEDVVSQLIETYTKNMQNTVGLVELKDIKQVPIAARLGGEEVDGIRQQFIFDLPWRTYTLLMDFVRVDHDGRTIVLQMLMSTNDAAHRVTPAFEQIQQTFSLY